MRNKVIDLLDQTIEELDKEKIDGILEIPPKDDMGDFAFPCFQLAKVFRKAPNMIATEIAEKIPASEDVSKVEAMGPYVNFFLNKENYVKEVLAKVNGTYGAQEIGKGKTVCIDYSSPNIAKNFHVGHLRTTIIGNSLYHIFDKQQCSEQHRTDVVADICFYNIVGGKLYIDNIYLLPCIFIYSAVK